MKIASSRPIEVSNNLNPAFCGEILRRCAFKYQSLSQKYLPITLVYFILPIVLHKETRLAIGNTRKDLHPWLQEHPQAKVDFAKRVKGFEDITNETLAFLLKELSVEIYTKSIKIINYKPLQSEKFTSAEIKDCMKKAEKLGQWLANAGTPANIYIMWGVRP